MNDRCGDMHVSRLVCWSIVPLCLGLLLWSGLVWGEETTATTLPESVIEAQRLSGRADVLASDGREREAARFYLEAHQKFQAAMEKFFEIALHSSVKDATVAEDTLLRTDLVVADLRDLNLTKLWVLLDPDDRAFERMLEEERADLLRRFPEFTTPLRGGPLEDFLLRLYPDDAAGSRQLEALREGRLPSSARWTRLESGRVPQ